MCLSSGRWWLAHSRSLMCGRFLPPLWKSREPYWIRDVGRGAFSTSWTGRGMVRRRDAGFRWRTCWILLCCESSTVSIRIALCLTLWVVPGVRVGVRLCYDFCRSWSLSLFGRCPADDVTDLLAIAAPFFTFHWFCLVSHHTWFQSHHYMLCI